MTYHPERQHGRLNIDAEVRLRFKDLSGLERQYAANISLGGMYIRSDAPKPVGSAVHFELVLSDDSPVITGVGEVVWTHTQREPNEPPSGMGIRFQKLGDLSRELILRMMETYLSQGGEPFEIRNPKPPAAAAGIDATPESRSPDEPASPPPGPGQPCVEDVTELLLVPKTEPAAAAEGTPPKSPPESSPASQPAMSRQVDLVLAELARLKGAGAEAGLAAIERHSDDGRASSHSGDDDDSTAVFEVADPRSPEGEDPKPQVGPAASEAGPAHAEGHAPDRTPQPGGAIETPVAGPTVSAAHAPEPPEDPTPGLPWIAERPPSPLQGDPGAAAERRPLSPWQPVATPEIPETDRHSPPQPSPSSPGPRRRLGVWIAATLALATVTALLVTTLGPRPPSQELPAERGPEPDAATGPEDTTEPAAPPQSLSLIDSLNMVHSKGSTILRISGNGYFEPGRFVHHTLDQSREVIKVLGIKAPFEPPATLGETPQVKRVRVGHHPDLSEGELHFVIDLADPQARVMSVEALGSALFVVLE